MYSQILLIYAGADYLFPMHRWYGVVLTIQNVGTFRGAYQ